MGFNSQRVGKNNTERDWSNQQVAMISGAIAAAAVMPGLFAYTALAQTVFPDVPADYWAQPFIEKLAQQDIVEGYPDGTFRPEEAIDRDEYAAIIRKAFDADTERTIPSGSALGDVPENYWAAPAIEEAYETGFMGTPEPNEFNPQNEITRVNAILALVQGLEPQEPTTVSSATVATPPTPSPETTPQVVQQRGTPFHLAIPMASTQVMQVFAPPASDFATPSPGADTNAVDTAAVSPDVATPDPIDLSAYYTDADQIPDYARDEVATATRLGLIVNYPAVGVLNPTEPLSRGSAAALIHQTLVYRDQLEPLPEGSATAAYVVEEATGSSND
jgi:hypothetical protein